MYVYHIFFIQSSIEGAFDCLHVLPTLNNAAMNIGGQIILQINIFEFFG